MKKKQLLICNKSLLVASPIVLASGILLEYLYGNAFLGIDNAVWTWLHVIVSSILTVLVAWHIRLNWRGFNQWYDRFSRHRPKGSKVTAFFFIITIATGLLALPLWLSHGHIGIGGVHGKFGFIAAFFILLHIVRHWKWYGR